MSVAINAAKHISHLSLPDASQVRPITRLGPHDLPHAQHHPRSLHPNHLVVGRGERGLLLERLVRRPGLSEVLDLLEEIAVVRDVVDRDRPAFSGIARGAMNERRSGEVHS